MPYKCKFFGGLGMGDEPVDACRNFRASEWVCPYAETWTFHKCEYRWMPTNAERLRSMSDEELANVLTTINNSKEHPHGDWLDWLKQEADNGK